MRLNRLMPVALLVLSSGALSCAGCTAYESCRDGQEATATPLVPMSDAGLLAFAHAHNDYEHPHPLDDALAAGFHSVEADVYFADGRFEVRHTVLEPVKGTLEGLYLKPLQQKVDVRGSVLGDGEGFTLWVDFKDNDARLPEALEALLAQYPMLTRIDGESVATGPVTVALTGDATAKQHFADLAAPRHAFRDSNDFRLDDPPADARWRYYALNYSGYVPWSGGGTPSAEAERKLSCLMSNAHALGRKVRLFNAPDVPEAWELFIRHGVDFIGTDQLDELSSFMRQQ